MLNKRDQLILQYLKHFRVLTRDHIGSLVCPEVKRPYATVNRIMKRLDRDGHILTIPRPKDECYIYMPNPALIHTESSKLRHYLAIVDFYLRIGKPRIYEVEPHVSDDYRPDVYTIVKGQPILIELQRSHISKKKMLDKINNFVQSNLKGEHDARTLWVVTDENFGLTASEGFQVQYIKLTQQSPLQSM